MKNFVIIDPLHILYRGSQDKQLRDAKIRLTKLVGKDYDGTPDSIAEDSQQKHCLNAINIFIPHAFDNQQRFTECIQNAEAQIKNKV